MDGNGECYSHEDCVWRVPVVDNESGRRVRNISFPWRLENRKFGIEDVVPDCTVGLKPISPASASCNDRRERARLPPLLDEGLASRIGWRIEETVRDEVAAHASICQRSSSTNVMETDCREHTVAKLDCCVAFDVNAHSAPNMGFEGLKNMETDAFDVNDYSTINLCLDGQHELKNMESDVIFSWVDGCGAGGCGADAGRVMSQTHYPPTTHDGAESTKLYPFAIPRGKDPRREPFRLPKFISGSVLISVSALTVPNQEEVMAVGIIGLRSSPSSVTSVEPFPATSMNFTYFKTSMIVPAFAEVHGATVEGARSPQPEGRALLNGTDDDGSIDGIR
ncbi:hypothetical protein F3Y22_tig00112429pilonHSYRG00028 [Hibiscus syriacus]|uniref:Uncharacterized protein n=1 Tax=Hibiscus syriacus TaxID=106335 RepID=A0A6A2XCJ5_HIBSY|nr:hypothetical protein F3Y22_tig00112429pilonHSYRG00028 [Hibiscus syriacus]